MACPTGMTWGRLWWGTPVTLKLQARTAGKPVVTREMGEVAGRPFVPAVGFFWGNHRFLKGSHGQRGRCVQRDLERQISHLLGARSKKPHSFVSLAHCDESSGVVPRGGCRLISTAYLALLFIEKNYIVSSELRIFFSNAVPRRQEALASVWFSPSDLS